MWKSLGIVLTSPVKSQLELFSAKKLLQQQLRTTFILKRKTPAQLHKKGEKPKTLRSRHYVYDLVKQTDIERQPNIDVVLKSDVEGVGTMGEKVSVRPNIAYNKLLLPGLAVYATPENLEEYKEYRKANEGEQASSPNALITVKIMSRMTLSVIMNKETPWTLKPWHVKISFRKCGYIVPDDAITLPETPIVGPDMTIENKEFFVTVTVNNKEKVNVRCRIHHWSTNITDRLPYVPFFWQQPSEAIIPEQVAILETIPKKPPKTVKSVQ